MAPPPSSSAALAQLWLFALCAALCATVDGLSGGAVGPGDVLGMAWCWAAVLSGGSPAVVGVAAGMRCAIVAARLPRCLAFEWMCLQSDAVSTPRDAAPTALSAAARLVFFAGPDAVEAVFSAVDAVGALTGLGLLCACCFEPNGFFDWRDWSGDDWCLVVSVPVLGFLLRVFHRGAAPRARDAPGAAATAAVVALALAQSVRGPAFGTTRACEPEGLPRRSAPLLGLSGSRRRPSANLRVHGGSNHWLAPTGLLLSTRTGLARLDDAYYDAGAVVRVEATTSPTLRAAFPGEVRLDPPGVEKVVRVGKQAGRTFDSGRALAGRSRADLERHPPPPAYTVPLAALLDVLAAAARDAETFDVTFAVLPGRAGDEAWRATAAARPSPRYEAGALAACEGDEAACDRPLRARAAARDVPRLPISTAQGSCVGRVLRAD
ncbi:hypothetical protein JL722_11754 [Aureococcus anophagefferens]|nr:hypothetical protein JL722_11754 [Aureococcus anophagefferens]